MIILRTMTPTLEVIASLEGWGAEEMTGHLWPAAVPPARIMGYFRILTKMGLKFPPQSQHRELDHFTVRRSLLNLHSPRLLFLRNPISFLSAGYIPAVSLLTPEWCLRGRCICLTSSLLYCQSQWRGGFSWPWFYRRQRLSLFQEYSFTTAIKRGLCLAQSCWVGVKISSCGAGPKLFIQLASILSYQSSVFLQRS